MYLALGIAYPLGHANNPWPSTVSRKLRKHIYSAEPTVFPVCLTSLTNAAKPYSNSKSIDFGHDHLKLIERKGTKFKNYLPSIFFINVIFSFQRG